MGFSNKLMWYSQRFPWKEPFRIVSHIFIPFTDCSSRNNRSILHLALLNSGQTLAPPPDWSRPLREKTAEAEEEEPYKKGKKVFQHQQEKDCSKRDQQPDSYKHHRTHSRKYRERQNTFEKNPTQIGLACKRQKICQERRDSKACVRTFPTFGNQPKSRGIKLSPKPRNCRSQNEIC